jgi:hypothetical protein
MKTILFIFSLIVSTISFSQTLKGELNGNKYLLTETSTGGYIIKVKSQESGAICSCELTVNKTNGDTQYCTSKVVSGNCIAWEVVKVISYDIPGEIPFKVIYGGDGFDNKRIEFYPEEYIVTQEMYDDL